MSEAPPPPTLVDVLRLPCEVGKTCALADLAACAFASKSTYEALLEAYDGKLPRATLQVLVRDAKRFIWAVDALQIPIEPRDDRAAAAAAGEGEIETLQWIAEQQQQTSCGPSPLVRSAGRGASLDWSVAVCREAARGGHLHIVRYLRLMLGCPWDGSVCANAAAGGHLQVLQWLREKGCPWHKDTPAWAELNGHIMVKVPQRFESRTPDICDAIRNSCHALPTLSPQDWAIANGCDYSEDMVLRLRMSRMMAAMQAQ